MWSLRDMRTGYACAKDIRRAGREYFCLSSFSVSDIRPVLAQKPFGFRAEFDRERPFVIAVRCQDFQLAVAHLFAAHPKPQLQLGPVGALD